MNVALSSAIVPYYAILAIRQPVQGNRLTRFIGPIVLGNIFSAYALKCVREAVLSGTALVEKIFWFVKRSIYSVIELLYLLIVLLQVPVEVGWAINRLVSILLIIY